METTSYGLDEFSDESLTARITLQSKELKTATKDTLINRWESGKRLTEKQIEYLKSKKLVDESEIKSVIVKVPVFDKDTNEYMGLKPVTKYFNKLQNRVDRAISNDVITEEESVMSNNRFLEANSRNLEMKNVVINHSRAELSATKAVKHDREEARIAKEMETRNLAFLTRKEIYEKAVTAQKLMKSDMEEHVVETTPLIPA